MNRPRRPPLEDEFSFARETPVAFFVFNRPELTARVFQRIRELRPARLIVVADGPRQDHPTDGDRVKQVRQIVENVDWDCQVIREYSDVNLGCGRRVSSGLDRVFRECDRAIVLEDDCLPDPSFFPYAAELLERYAADERIMAIGGTNFHPKPWSRASYSFSGYGYIWGWATWRRAWKKYDVEMRSWPKVRPDFRDLGDGTSERFWGKAFDLAHSGAVDTWDYQWTYACLVNGGLTAFPHVNLVSNIGFTEEATHTRVANHIAGRSVTQIAFPLRHPAKVVRDRRADRLAHLSVFELRPPFKSRVALAVRSQWTRVLRLIRGFRSTAGEPIS